MTSRTGLTALMLAAAALWVCEPAGSRWYRRTRCRSVGAVRRRVKKQKALAAAKKARRRNR